MCLAATGSRRDEPPADDAARARLRRQALNWLTAETAAWGKHLESCPPRDRGAVSAVLRGWTQDPVLTAVRDSAALATRPPDEHGAFRVLWSDAAAVLKSARTGHAAHLLDQLTDARKTRPKGSPALAEALDAVGKAHLELDEWASSETALRESLAIREAALPNSWLTFNAYTALGGVLLGQKRYADAEPQLLKGYRGLKTREASIPRVGRDRLPEGLYRLVELSAATNRPAEAARWRVERARHPEAADDGP